MEVYKLITSCMLFIVIFVRSRTVVSLAAVLFFLQSHKPSELFVSGIFFCYKDLCKLLLDSASGN